ncbi:MAG: glutamate 5-kinase [Helicobacteraceae bacterium]|jgi:glutamate 5-kinase|nr:glutamate 5-kinase [Helicobacteraceae bacterium]
MRIAVKVGTSTLCDRGVPSLERMGEIVAFLQEIHKENELILVSSGAVAAGHSVVPELSNKKTPERQALAAVGQAVLMNIYADLFKPYHINVAQILIAKDDFENFSHSENAKIALNTLLAHRILPIINENDTVALDELLRGDNDQLSAKVAYFFDADLLIILTDVDGYYDANPQSDPNARIVPLVCAIPQEALESRATPNGEFATGGIVTKLKAADYLLQRGKKMFLSSGFDLSHARNFLKTGVYEKGTLFCQK